MNDIPEEAVKAEVQLDPNAVIDAVRECARITSPEVTDEEFEALRADNDPLYANTTRDMERAIRAYLSALPFLPVQVAVKKMAWIRPPLSDTLSRCDTDFGTYRTWTHDEANGKWFWSVEGGWNEANGEAPNEEAAKAAAQAGYEARILSALEPSALDMGNPITLTYTNYRGETSERAITPIRPWFGSTEWHPEPQWLLRAYDHDKGAERDFALKDFGRQQPSAARELALEEAARAAENAALEYNLSECAGLADWAAFEAGQESGLKHAAAAIRALSSPDHADAGKAEGDGWMPIESAPKDGKIDIWATDNDGKGRRVTDCYYDRICDEWRTSAPALRLHCVKARYVTHWLRLPTPPSGEVA